jgi:hypothetical protein
MKVKGKNSTMKPITTYNHYSINTKTIIVDVRQAEILRMGLGKFLLISKGNLMGSVVEKV